MASLAKSGRNERRVLMMDATARDAQLLEKLTSDDRITAEAFRDVKALCREIEAGATAILLTERSLDQNSDAVADCLSRQPDWSDMPVLLALPGGGPAARRAAAKFGNVHIQPRLSDAVTIATAVRNALRARLRQYELRYHQNELKRLVITYRGPRAAWCNSVLASSCASNAPFTR